MGPNDFRHGRSGRDPLTQRNGVARRKGITTCGAERWVAHRDRCAGSSFSPLLVRPALPPEQGLFGCLRSAGGVRRFPCGHLRICGYRLFSYIIIIFYSIFPVDFNPVGRGNFISLNVRGVLAWAGVPVE